MKKTHTNGKMFKTQASDEQQQMITEKNTAKVYSEKLDSPSLAVTNNGITIEPGFEMVNVYQALRG